MTDWIYDARPRRDGVTIPTFWIAIALSLLVHVAAMWHWLPRLEIPALAIPERDTLEVRLTPPPGPRAPASSQAARPAPAVAAPPSPALPARQPQAPRPPPASPVIALNQPAPSTPAPGVAAPSSVRPPATGDLASYIESRRLARGDAAPSTQPVDDEKSRSNQVASANLAQQQLAFGYDPSRSGGMFEIRRIGYSDAEFVFFGWNKEVRHRTAQLIEVRRGENNDIRLAIVRRMIAIIRQHEQGDFEWSSPRLSRDIMLSARARDNAGLEDFLMLEFFNNPRPSR